jgi:redox-sensitive bicupin YhaK (pirin superfamily)
MRFIQMWILPSEADLEPSVEQRVWDVADRTNRLLEVFNPEGSDRAVKVHGDARVFVSRLEEGHRVEHQFERGRSGYLYVIRGSVRADGQNLDEGDAAEIHDHGPLQLEASETSELVLVDVPPVYEPVGVWRRMS